jgi:hypothetical protein
VGALLRRASAEELNRPAKVGMGNLQDAQR